MAKENKYTAQQVDIAKIAKALGHPARVAILEYLASLDHCKKRYFLISSLNQLARTAVVK